MILFKFYSSYDIWTSNGVHLVFQPDENSSGVNVEAGNLDETEYDQTNITEVQEDTTLVADNDETLEGLVPNAESTLVSNGDTNSNLEEESTEADRNHLQKKKKKKIQIIKTKAASKINKKMKSSCCSFVTDASEVMVGGQWINISD